MRSHSPNAIDSALKRFAVAYAVATLPTALKHIKRGNSRALLDRNSAKIAAIPAILPPLYTLIQRLVERFSHATTSSSSHNVDDVRKKALASRVAALLCSPLLLGLPSSVRIYVVIYAFTGALRAFIQGKREKGADVEGWRRYVPPIWTLAFSNMVMLPLWTFGPEGSFPKGYDAVIMSVSIRTSLVVTCRIPST